MGVKLTNTLTLTLVAAVVVAFLASLPAVAADPEPPSPHQLRAQMIPVYQTLQTDLEYLAFREQLARRPDDLELFERYLRYLPISPLLMLEIDMYLNRYEFVIPRYLAGWHLRWIELHEREAVEMYGKAYVDARLRNRLGAGDEDGASAGVWGTKALNVDTNRNMATDYSPAPQDYQGEVQVAVNPLRSNEIVAAANTWDGMSGDCGGGIQAVFYSGDGGTTWGYTCAPGAGDFGLSCTGFLGIAGTVYGSDPAVTWNDNHQVFLEYMLICDALFTARRYAIVVARSTDAGATWSGRGTVVGWNTTIEDKNFYAIDNNSSSSYHGRHYTCWDRNNDEKAAYSTDGGATWTEVNLPSTTGSGTGDRLDLGCELAVEDDGTVHVVYDTLSCGATTCNNEEMFYSRSTNGGASWSTPVEVRDFNLVGFSGNNCPDAQDERCIGPMGAIDVDNSGGSCDGTLYVTYADYTSGDVNDTDVWVKRSTNDGATWSAAVRVNDGGVADRAQFHPFLVVDQSSGDVVVGWHDARNDSGNDAVDFYVARSTDCGQSFEANIQASQASSEFNNSTITYSNENSSDNSNNNPNQYGEYLGLDARNGKAYLAWTDTRHYFPNQTSESQKENLGFTVVDFDYDAYAERIYPSASDGSGCDPHEIWFNYYPCNDWKEYTVTPGAWLGLYAYGDSCGGCMLWHINFQIQEDFGSGWQTVETHNPEPDTKGMKYTTSYRPSTGKIRIYSTSGFYVKLYLQGVANGGFETGSAANGWLVSAVQPFPSITSNDTYVANRGEYSLGNASNGSDTYGVSDNPLWGYGKNVPAFTIRPSSKLYFDTYGDNYPQYTHYHVRVWWTTGGTTTYDAYVDFNQGISYGWSQQIFDFPASAEGGTIDGIEVTFHKDHTTYSRFQPTIFMDNISLRH